MIAAVTAGWRMTNASAMWISEMPASSASCAERVGGVELALVPGHREVVAAGDHRRAPRGQVLGALAPPARQPAAGERAPRDHAHAVALAGRQHVGLDAADEHRVGRLLADEALAAAVARHPLGLDDLRRRERRRADVADLALVRRGRESAPSVSSMSVSGLGAVDLVEVDPVGLQAAQRGLDLADDPAPRVARLVGVVAHRAVDLRREHDVVAPPLRAPCRRSPRTRRASTRRRCR